MIDFRYHVVSLVSVFVALAVGIVLGAGPLGGPIDQQFQNEVSRLTATNAQQKADLESAAKAIKERDDFANQLTPTLVARQLLGRSVALVSLPNADGDTVKAAAATLEAAGAHVTTHIEIKSAWTDPNTAAERAAVLAKLAPAVPSASAALAVATPTASASPGSDPSSNPSSTVAALVGGVGTAKATPTHSPSPKPAPTLTLAAVLARDVLTANPVLSSQPDADAEAELTQLAKAGMINIAGDFTGKATQVVLVAPTVKDATVAGDGQSASPATDDTPVWLQLATQLDAAGDGAVVEGPPSSAAGGGVVAVVRDDADLVKRVSTVDTGGTPMGALAVVFALREQLAGAAGAYGYGRGATAPLPATVLAP
jgi:Copper transport outer membrane protein, MctB